VTTPGSPWFAGAWRRRSIAVPGGVPTEPCEAWWLQSDSVFVDVRVALPGREDNGLPFSSTGAFAGRFELVDGGVRWHVELDSGGVVPRSDGAGGVDLFLDSHDPLLMIEDAPGRFREEWVRPVADPAVASLHTPELIAVQVGEVVGAVWVDIDGALAGRVWHGRYSVGVGSYAIQPPALDAWLASRARMGR
jgi:hypothetical protein